MISTITKYEFERAFIAIRPDNFSRAGLDAMFDYFEEYEEETGEQIELDVIAICCEYSEYENFEEVARDYDGIDTLEDLRDRSTVIEIDGGGLIIQSF
jgi:hypothetical protein